MDHTMKVVLAIAVFSAVGNYALYADASYTAKDIAMDTGAFLLVGYVAHKLV